MDTLHEFYASYKAICDGYTINLMQFEQIFSLDQTVFSIWDSQDEGVVDSFELFTGLILYSKIEFEDKLDFLFEIFNFNDTEEMNEMEIELLFNCAFSSVFKIKGVREAVSESEIRSFVAKKIGMGVSMSKKQLLGWAYKLGGEEQASGNVHESD